MGSPSIGVDKPGVTDFTIYARHVRKVYPIERIDWYSSDLALVARKPGKGAIGPPPRGDRKPITELSTKSRMRLAFVALATKTVFRSILTLTYHNDWPEDGKALKADLNRFLTAFRRRFYGGYLWFLEFQERDAPHFHLLLEMHHTSPRQRIATELWLTATGNIEDAPMRDVHNHKRTFEGIRTRDGALRYALKYATKPTQKTVPDEFGNVGRFWGVSASVMATIGVCGQMAANETTAKAILDAFDHPTKDWGVVPKYLFNLPRAELVDQSHNL